MKKKTIRRHLDAARELELLVRQCRRHYGHAHESHKRFVKMGSDFLRGYYAGQAGAYAHIKADASHRARKVRGYVK